MNKTAIAVFGVMLVVIASILSISISVVSGDYFIYGLMITNLMAVLGVLLIALGFMEEKK